MPKTRQIPLSVWQTYCSQKLAIADDLQVLGYYTLSASLIDFPESFPNKDKLPSYPITVVLIAYPSHKLRSPLKKTNQTAIAYSSHINNDRFSNNHITRRSLFAKSKTAIALNDIKQMLGL
jgi:hypothetical protein